MSQSDEIWLEFEGQKVVDLVAVHVLELNDDYLSKGPARESRSRRVATKAANTYMPFLPRGYPSLKNQQLELRSSKTSEFSFSCESRQTLCI